MATKPQSHAVAPGDMLIVIHDFIARSSDELTLRRGERIELIERDDEFGDGWYLGKHAKTEESGLFPEVYTTPAARLGAKASFASNSSPARPDSGFSTGYSQKDNVDPSLGDERSNAVQPVTAGNAFSKRTQTINTRSVSLGNMGHQITSPVMNETLSVIEEHITDMHTPRQSFLDGTTYNTHEDDFLRHSPSRLSYINGHETDEEDEAQLGEKEVRQWTPFQVAEHLEHLGAEQAHCNVFKEQEINGDVLLDMDRETVLLKEFELGTLGRRLALFQKIQRFQTEVKGPRLAGSGGSRQSPRSSQRSTSMTSYSESTRDRMTTTSGATLGGHSGASMSGTVLPKIPTFTESPTTYAAYGNNRQRSASATRQELLPVDTSKPTPGHVARPSNNSTRSVPHNRRHSSIDYTSAPNTPQQASMNIPPSPAHKKQDSFDKSWTMGPDGTPQSVAVADSQPSTGSGHLASPSVDSSMLSPGLSDYRTNMANAVDLDRGYFSSNETGSRKTRGLLRKRDSGSHTRVPSDGYSSLRLSGVFKHIRSGSTDSVNDSTNNDSSFLSLKGMSRAFSSAGTKDSPTKSNREDSPGLESIAYSSTAVGSMASTVSQPSPSLSINAKPPRTIKPRTTGLRAISDAVTGNEKSLATRSKLNVAPSKEETVQSPGTNSSNQSVTSTGKSVSIEDKKDGATNSLPTGKYVTFPANMSASRRKMKHETSAYTKGLEKKTPAEQIAGSDYSGWMKKKSKNLGKWHSRLFVLRGRRLSYYYSEDDKEEKGLIDISFHRVLPVGKDIITNFHATLRGASSGPVSPEGASLQTAAQIDSATSPRISTDASGIFIFKLVPPRPGLSKAVNFTQPKVHFFAVPSLQEGRYWMAALMKATIERDEIKPISSTYKEKTISLSRAKELRVRPEEFLNEDSATEAGAAPCVDAEDHAAKDDQPVLGDIKEADKDAASDGWSLINSTQAADMPNETVVAS